MKSLARDLGILALTILFQIIPDLWRKLDDNPSERARGLIGDRQTYRKNYWTPLSETPELLGQWFYENQGVRRFDASNRLFLVLVDKVNFFRILEIFNSAKGYKELSGKSKITDVGFQLDLEQLGRINLLKSRCNLC